MIHRKKQKLENIFDTLSIAPFLNEHSIAMQQEINESSLKHRYLSDYEAATVYRGQVVDFFKENSNGNTNDNNDDCNVNSGTLVFKVKHSGRLDAFLFSYEEVLISNYRQTGDGDIRNMSNQIIKNCTINGDKCNMQTAMPKDLSKSPDEELKDAYKSSAYVLEKSIPVMKGDTIEFQYVQQKNIFYILDYKIL